MRINIKDHTWGKPSDMAKYEERWFERKRFLFFPKKIGSEVRWLEKGHWFVLKWWGSNMAHIKKQRWVEEMTARALTSELVELGLDK